MGERGRVTQRGIDTKIRRGAQIVEGRLGGGAQISYGFLKGAHARSHFLKTF